jgi:hypothetical protein
MALKWLFNAGSDFKSYQKFANKRGKVRKFRILVYFIRSRISKTADEKTTNNEGHL